MKTAEEILVAALKNAHTAAAVGDSQPAQAPRACQLIHELIHLTAIDLEAIDRDDLAQLVEGEEAS